MGRSYDVTTWVRDENSRDWCWNPSFGIPNKANLTKLVTNAPDGAPPYAILWKFLRNGEKRVIATYGNAPKEEIDRITQE